MGHDKAEPADRSSPVNAGRPPSRPTMNDVAARAGVGLSTVSRVVSGDTRVSEARSALVRQAIRELGFRRNDSARQLRRGATESIGLVIEDVVDPFFSHLAQAVEEVAFARNSLLLTSSSTRDAERTMRIVLEFCARRVDGLIITPSESDEAEYLREELDAGVPMVFVDRPPPGGIDADSVLTDDFGGARSGVGHLIAHGHRRIACFSDRDSLYSASERVRGYRDSLEVAGITVDPTLIHSATPEAEGFARALARMLAGAEPPTAVFAANNRSTIVLLRELVRHEMRPALVGFDDFELADAMSPGVTVVAQFPGEIGRTAAEQLFRRIDGARGPSHLTSLRTRLIVRGSGEVPPAT